MPMPSNASPTIAAAGGGSEDSRRPTIVPPPAASSPELSDRPRRRTFTADEKLRVLAEVDRASDTGGIGAILRREGLYSSLLTDWRRQRTAGAYDRLTPAKRGPKAAPVNPLAVELALARAKNVTLQRRLDRAEAIIDLEFAIDRAAGTSRWTEDDGDLFAVLQSEGWDFKVTDKAHTGLLLIAAERGNAAFLAKLLAAGTDATTRLGCEALAAALDQKNTGMAGALLDAGAPVRWPTPLGDFYRACDAMDAAARAGLTDLVQEALARRGETRR